MLLFVDSICYATANKDNIKREIRGIPAGMLGRVIDNFNARIGADIRQKDAWIELPTIKEQL